VVAVIARGEHLLVIRRSATVVAPLAYCFPGGGIESQETEPAALIRELREELAVIVQPVRQLWRSTTPWNVELSWWQADLPADARIVPNPAEVASLHWHTPEEMSVLPGLLESNRHFLEAWRRGEFTLLT
jgi:8-oxo-dGTP diphosphatase